MLRGREGGQGALEERRIGLEGAMRGKGGAPWE